MLETMLNWDCVLNLNEVLLLLPGNLSTEYSSEALELLLSTARRVAASYWWRSSALTWTLFWDGVLDQC
jgi:hypothetical protein